MIKVNNLTKRFGSNLAVDNVSFSVGKGEVLGFLGPNGAGKSTTMRMITGFFPPDSGTVTIKGYDIENDPIEAKATMGYLPENAPSYEDMTVTAFLKFIASLRGLSGRERTDAVEKAIETCFLQPVRHQTIETLSKGYRHRTCFAQSILHDPEILIMDEPTDGLDPNQKHEVRKLIKRMSERKAIIISTHILEEVDAVCTKIIVINNGKLVASGIPSELKAKSKSAGSYTISIAGQKYRDIAEKLEKLDFVSSVLSLKEDDNICTLRVTPKEGEFKDQVAENIHNLITNEKWKLREFFLDKGRLDDIFRDITTADGREGNK